MLYSIVYILFLYNRNWELIKYWIRLIYSLVYSIYNCLFIKYIHLNSNTQECIEFESTI